MNRSRRFELAAAGLACRRYSRMPVAALDYPTRPVRLVVGFPAGGSADIVARIVAQALTERMGQTFVVDNKPGAGSNIGTETVARAEPDGYTLMADSVSNAINPTLYKKLNYDQLKDLVPVASIDVVPNVMDINVDVPAKTVPEFIAYAKANPGKITHGLGRHRLVAACRRRAVQDDDRRRHAARTLSRRRAGDDRSAGRAHPGVVRHAARGDRQHPRRQDPRARGDLEEALRRRCRTCRR